MKNCLLNSCFLFVLICAHNSFGQSKILFTGNVSKICLESVSYEIHSSLHFPDSINNYDVIFIFSGAQTILKDSHIESLLEFLQSGKGVYLGSENWPLQAESNQLTSLLFSKQAWGNFSQENAEFDKETGLLSDLDTLPAGTTTVSFPLDYRLKVIAWVEDEPLIQIGETLGGQIILDGGYSRFYCDGMKDVNSSLLHQFVTFLAKP